MDKSKHTFRGFIVGIFLVIPVLLAYQNCGQTPSQGALKKDSISLASTKINEKTFYFSATEDSGCIVFGEIYCSTQQTEKEREGCVREANEGTVFCPMISKSEDQGGVQNILNRKICGCCDNRCITWCCNDGGPGVPF